METQPHDKIMYSLGKLESKVDLILDQATKTNGRVTILEKDLSEIKVNQGVTKTKLGIIGAVAGGLMSWVLSLIKN